MTGRFAWLAAGVGIGLAVARRIERSDRASSVEAAAVGIARQARRVVDAVVADGRAEMRQREARLRTVLAAPDATTAPVDAAELPRTLRDQHRTQEG